MPRPGAPAPYGGRAAHAKKLIAVKSTVHFLADFAPIAAEVLYADSPGAHPCRLERVPFRNLRPGVRLGPNGPLSA